eukprot:CAMPEP_0114478056 /NCGR_PEP_ID=MMETSP0104-20121206/15746_1 /TAXON_ID=37642 ORGANISM="Paraphysomonas imperforata, Strain PA2" /NCGR_SAMPLE_ID=MMETSP0104 /ASSEMBLY_ACC=CAM_ASM_000202 /LENGTH=180 /DNA_ID=CAMNT_0001653151 /DNA_START=261 /DNA_END=800 /DNA_ORIENTATION=-
MAVYFSGDQETLTFPEFAVMMNFFNSLSEKSLAEFLFEIIHDDHYIAAALGGVETGAGVGAGLTSVIADDTTEHVIHQLFGGAWGNEAKIAKILAHMRPQGQGQGQGQEQKDFPPCDSFVKYCLSNRSLLHMPVTHQLALRGKIVSEQFWIGRKPVIPVRSCAALRRELLHLEAMSIDFM